MGFNFGQKIIDKIRGKSYTQMQEFYSKSYAQCGEDLIVNFILTDLFKQKNINYLDIGAHHSSWLSNTKLFYDKGFKGLLVEPDPELFKEIKKNRSLDTCLNCGIGVTNEKDADFYVMNAPTLNTFSKEEADKLEKNSDFRIKNIIKIELKNINDILNKYFSEGLDFLSLDVEGLDLQILKKINFNNIRPKVICVETLNFDTDRKKQHKEEDIIDFLKEQKYFVYADTFINTIFVDKTIW